MLANQMEDASLGFPDIQAAGFRVVRWVGLGLVPTMQKLLSALLLSVALAALPARAADLSGIPAVSERMDSFVEAGEVAGAVTLVADGQKILDLSCVGMADLEDSTPMTENTVFWIASMTKPVTGTAVMMLVEQGLLSVEDSVATYLPEFKDLKDKAGNEVTITIRQCLTHSSGLEELSLEESAKIPNLKEMMPLIAAKPVKFTPGSEWVYCQTGINTAARIVEVISGESFPEFVEKRLFRPLDMRDTTFYPTEEMRPRIATSYRRKADGKLEESAIFMLAGKSVTARDRCPMANGGLFSTAPDYARFCQMILNGGEWNGRRYLKPESVKEMTTVQSGDLVTGFTPGNGWGLGWCVVREPQGVSAALSPGSFGHGGAYGTQAWIDPVKKRIDILMVQRANFPNSDASELRRALHEEAAKP